MTNEENPMTGVSDEAVEAGCDGIERRIGWASMHWGTRNLHPDALEHLARAALEAAAPLLVADAVAERDAEIERLRAANVAARAEFSDAVEEGIRQKRRANEARAELAGVVAAVEAVADEWDDLANDESDPWARGFASAKRATATDLRAALSSTGAGEALARVRAQAWEEGHSAGMNNAAGPPEPFDNPYRATKRGADDE